MHVDVENEIQRDFTLCLADLHIAAVSQGKIAKNLSESFEATLEVNASGNPQVLWTKVKSRTTDLEDFVFVFSICNELCHF